MEQNLKTFDDLLSDMVDILTRVSGKFMEEIANQVFSQKVEYVGDNLFKIENN